MASADGADGHQADTKGLEDNSPTTISGAAAPPGGAKAFLLTNRSLAVGLLVVVIGLAASIWFSTSCPMTSTRLRTASSSSS